MTNPNGAIQATRTATPLPARQPAPAPAPTSLPPALVKMAADGLSLRPGTVTTGPDGKPRLSLDGKTRVGQVPVAGKVQLSGEPDAKGLPRAVATGAGTVDGVPVAGQAKLGVAQRQDGLAGAVVSGNGTVSQVAVTANASVGVGMLPGGKPGARINGTGRVDGLPVNGQVDVAIDAGKDGKPRALVNGDVKVANVPVRGDFVVTPTPAPHGQTGARTVGTLTTPVLPGTRANVDMKTAKGLNAGQNPSLQAALAVGPEIGGAVRQTAAQMTRQFIRTGHMPAGGFGSEVDQGLARLREMNRDGRMTGAVVVYVDIAALQRQAAAGIDQGARTTTWRRDPRVDRPGVRNLVMNTRRAQAMVGQEASKAVNQALRDVAAKSGGVVKFVPCRPGQTNGSGTYTADGVSMSFDATVANAAALLR